MPDQTKLDRCDCGAPIASDGACENDAHDDTTRTDGPDTELADAIAWVQSCDIAPGDLTAWMRDSPKTRSHVDRKSVV